MDFGGIYEGGATLCDQGLKTERQIPERERERERRRWMGG